MRSKLQFVDSFFRLMADAMLRIAGERIATPVCALVRNDMVFVAQSTDFGATDYQIFMSLRGGAQP